MSYSPTRVVLLSSNGAGMGHLTRLLAYGRRMEQHVQPYVVSLSQAVPVVESYGYAWEYIPSQGATGMRPSSWRRMFADRVTELLARVRPSVLVFDGTHPYSGLDIALERTPSTRAVWSRRGMWKPGLNTDQLAKAAWFDLVLEPGDLAHDADRGSTVSARDAVRVRPVTLVDRAEMTSRGEARSSLGLPPDGPLALVSLGAGNINDTSDEVGAAVAALRQRGIGACVTSPAIAHQAYSGDNIHLVRHFPLSQHFAAFDYAISAAGYNSFHESLRLGLPTLFVPNRSTSLDDQQRRAEHAGGRGWALTAESLTHGRGPELIASLIEQGSALASAAAEADPGNGAAAAAAEIQELIG